MQEVPIVNRDYWFKVVDYLQHNWAIIDKLKGGGCIVYFFGDGSGVFDAIEYASEEHARCELRLNGFCRYEEEKDCHDFIPKPEPPFYECPHPNGRIYSSGRFWRSAKA